MYTIVIAAAALILFRVYRWNIVSDIARKFQRTDIRKIPSNHNEALLAQVWKSEIGRCYIHSVECQLGVGYCSSATQRSILKSITNFHQQDLPQPKFGPITLDGHAAKLEKNSKGMLKCEVIYATEGYDAFYNALKKINNVRFRVSVNFLRSSLFGIPKPQWNPMNILASFFGGHHSLLVGFFAEQNLVAVFDVNDTYGLFLVDARRLFDACDTIPVEGISGRSRGLVICEVLK